ncbi:MAG: SdpI family protein [Bacteroidia bacterium]|nr:SdpI family protein [Bacteroidia bacterium]
MNSPLYIVQLILSGTLALLPASFWLASRLKPNDYVGIRTEKSMRSRWVWQQAHRLALRWSVWATGPSIALVWVLPWLLGGNRESGLGVAAGTVVASALGQVGASYLAVRRYYRQYQLWRQLGYKQPPELDEQAEHLAAATPPLTEPTAGTER